jgi:hypothetical protein
MSDMSDFCRIVRIMSNTNNFENRIRIHPTDIHIKNNVLNRGLSLLADGLRKKLREAIA